MELAREPGKIYAPRPGKRTKVASDRRPELVRQHDRAEAAELSEGLDALTRSGATDLRCVVAKEAFAKLSEADRKYFKSVLHLSARLCLTALVGDWFKAGHILFNLADRTSDPERSRELAVKLQTFEPNGLEDKRMDAAA